MVLVWFVLTRALLPRSCVPLAALPGSTRTDLLRNDSDRPFGVFREQVQQHVVCCVLWKSTVATVLSLLCCCRACAVMLCLCDRMNVFESF